MIGTQALIDVFRMYIAEKWGYIWGTAGVMWTEAKQKQKVNYMVSKYGENWKSSQQANDDNYYYAALYGSKWIGHMVEDCSGAFVYAYRKFGEKIAHGSNSIYRSYCSSKGKLTKGCKADGSGLRPGTAVFTGTADKHGHIGLYVGDGKVIEASGTQAGVITSDVTNKKWTYWGELKAVDYDGTGPDPAPTPTPGSDKPTLRKGSTGTYVVECQKDLIQLGYDLSPYGADGKYGDKTAAAVKAFQKDHPPLVADGICGPRTWAELDEAIQPQPDPGQLEELYTVTIEHLDLTQAKALCNAYPTASMKKEGSGA